LPTATSAAPQALEWEAGAAPAGPGAMPSAAGGSALAASLGSNPEAAAADGKPAASSSLDNPVKHLVYRPTSLQLLAHMGCVAEALPRDGILLVYLALHARRQSEPSSARSATRPMTPASEAPKSPAGASAARSESRQEDPFGEGPGAADSLASMVAVAKDAAAKGLYLGPSRQPDPGNSYLLVRRPAGCCGGVLMGCMPASRLTVCPCTTCSSQRSTCTKSSMLSLNTPYSMEPIRMYTAGAGSGHPEPALNQRAISAVLTAIWPAYMLIPAQFDPA
jgi:hypothetical protein